jgi:BirA family biotin operon repressor/biotin-[acetyl-CoA-carboxylase] ligase
MAAIDIDSIRAAAGEGLRIEVVDAIASTNRSLMDRPFDALPAPPSLLAAERQTDGRGRHGRSWLMEPGRSAAFSIAIERSLAGAGPAAGLPIAVGVALARVLEPLAGPLGLKWPNDLQRNARKLGGILVESRRSLPAGALERYVIGIGLNLLAPAGNAVAIAQPVGGLFEGERLPLPAGRIVGLVARAVIDAVGQFFVDGLEAFADDWHRLDVLRGREVALLAGNRIDATGVVVGLDDEGALLLSTASGLKAVRSGEVSVRPLVERAPAGCNRPAAG